MTITDKTAIDALTLPEAEQIALVHTVKLIIAVYDRYCPKLLTTNLRLRRLRDSVRAQRSRCGLFLEVDEVGDPICVVNPWINFRFSVGAHSLDNPQGFMSTMCLREYGSTTRPLMGGPAHVYYAILAAHATELPEPALLDQRGMRQTGGKRLDDWRRLYAAA